MSGDLQTRKRKQKGKRKGELEALQKLEHQEERLLLQQSSFYEIEETSDDLNEPISNNNSGRNETHKKVSSNNNREKNGNKSSSADGGSGFVAKIIFVCLLIALCLVLALIGIELHTNPPKGSIFIREDILSEKLTPIIEKPSAVYKKKERLPEAIPEVHAPHLESVGDIITPPEESVAEETPPLYSFVTPKSVMDQPAEEHTVIHVDGESLTVESDYDDDVPNIPSKPEVLEDKEEVLVDEKPNVMSKKISSEESIIVKKASIQDDEPEVPVSVIEETMQEKADVVQIESTIPIVTDTSPLDERSIDQGTSEPEPNIAEGIQDLPIIKQEQLPEIGDDIDDELIDGTTEKSNSSKTKDMPDDNDDNDDESTYVGVKNIEDLYIQVESLAEEVMKLDPQNEIISEIAPHLEHILRSMEAGNNDGLTASLQHIQIILNDVKHRIEHERPIYEDEKEEKVEVVEHEPKDDDNDDDNDLESIVDIVTELPIDKTSKDVESEKPVEVVQIISSIEPELSSKTVDPPRMSASKQEIKRSENVVDKDDKLEKESFYIENDYEIVNSEDDQLSESNVPIKMTEDFVKVNNKEGNDPIEAVDEEISSICVTDLVNEIEIEANTILKDEENVSSKDQMASIEEDSPAVIIQKVDLNTNLKKTEELATDSLIVEGNRIPVKKTVLVDMDSDAEAEVNKDKDANSDQTPPQNPVNVEFIETTDVPEMDIPPPKLDDEDKLQAGEYEIPRPIDMDDLESQIIPHAKFEADNKIKNSDEIKSPKKEESGSKEVELNTEGDLEPKDNEVTPPKKQAVKNDPDVLVEVNEVIPEPKYITPLGDDATKLKQKDEKTKQKKKDEKNKSKKSKTDLNPDSIATELNQNAEAEQQKTKVVDRKYNEEGSSIVDDHIRDKLDEADKHINQTPLEAMNMFGALLQQYPKSARAMYGRAKSLGRLAEIEHSNQRLEQSIYVYRDVLDLADQEPELVPLSMIRLAAGACIESMRFRGWMGKAARIQQRLLKWFPDDVSFRNQLGVTFLLMNQPSAAEEVFKAVLDTWPDDGFAQVHYGFVLKTSQKNISGSIPYLEMGLKSGAEGTQDGRFFFHLGDAFQRLGQSQKAYQVYDDGVKKGFFLNRYQRSLYNVDRLLSRPLWTKEETTYQQFFRKLEENWESIRDEGVALLSVNPQDGFKPESENLQDTGDWKQFELFSRGRKITANCVNAPITCQLISDFKPAAGCKRGQAKFSVMQPGTHVWAHTGPTNCRLRSHLGLVVPSKGLQLRVGEKEQKWKEGKVFIFDDSWEHEVWHNGTTFRLVLIVDVWHPGLTDEERQTLAPI